MKLVMPLLLAVSVVILLLPMMTVAVVATHPWLAVGMLVGAVQVHDERPAAVRGVPADQWPLIQSAADGSSCGVTAQDLAAIAQTESNFGANLLNPVSGAFGYGQFDTATWAAYGSGDPNNPADALPAMARTLCARGYGVNRTNALNSYGGCVSANCLGNSSYADQIDRLAALVQPISGVVGIVEQWLGVSYSFGGCSRQGVDCSCLVQLVYAAMGKQLPRVASDQYAAVQHIPDSELQPGDLVFFANTYEPGISHVGIYIGNGQQINAPAEGQVVSVAPVFDGYWGAHYVGAGRVR